jgi:hypothetical protein
VIKLTDILREYRSTKGVEKYLKDLETNPKGEDGFFSQRVRVIWHDGDVVVEPTQDDQMKLMTKSIGRNTVQLIIEPSKKTVSISDYDDWSSFKTVPRFQQAIKDLVRLKLIKPTFKINIGMSDAKIILGKADVKTFLNYDGSYANVIPRAFHGTTSRDLKLIKRLGITPPSKHDHEILKWDSFYTEDSADKVYLSTDFDRAQYYANHAAGLYSRMKIDAKPVVLQIDNLPTDRIVADDDFLSNMSFIQMLSAMQTGKNIDPKSYIRSIRSTSQFGYKSRIPWSMISKTLYV